MPHQNHHSHFLALWRRLVALDSEENEAHIARQSKDNLDTSSLSVRGLQHLACVLYTSGTTGVPKGVMTEHRALVNRLSWMQSTYRLDEQDAVLQKTPFSFDVSIWEFLWPLMSGARLVMARPEGHKEPQYLRKIIQQERITTLHFVPSMLQLFLEEADAESCASLKRVICSGEELSASLVRQFGRTLPGVELHNLYGPTEAAIDVTAWACRAECFIIA